MKQGSYIVIQDWMVSELGLKGNELLIYALIYGFSMDGESEFMGSISYLEKWTGVARNTVKTILKKLVEKHLVTKRDFSKDNTHRCAYKTTKQKEEEVGQKLPQGGAETAPGGGAEIDPNNTNINNPNNKKENIKERDKLLFIFDAFRKKYKQYGGKVRGLQVEFDDLKGKHKDWKEIIPMLDYALEKENEEREKANSQGEFFPVMKNLKTYINQRSWEMYSDGWENYNPNEYHPSDLKYDNQFKAYRFWGISPQLSLHDGYDDDTRPNGARVVEQFNVWVWRSDLKDWEREPFHD